MTARPISSENLPLHQRIKEELREQLTAPLELTVAELAPVVSIRNKTLTVIVVTSIITPFAQLAASWSLYLFGLHEAAHATIGYIAPVIAGGFAAVYGYGTYIQSGTRDLEEFTLGTAQTILYERQQSDLESGERAVLEKVDKYELGNASLGI